MGVDDAMKVGPRLVNGRVKIEARDVDVIAVVGLQQRIAVDVDLDEVRCRDLLVEHPVGVDEIAALFARNARTDVVVDQVGHAMDGHQPVAGGEIDPGLPFLQRDGRLDVVDGEHPHIAHRRFPSM